MSLDLFLLEIAPCPLKQYLLFRDRHKNCNLYTVNSVAKCLKLACLNADWKNFFNVERIGLGFPLIPIILRRRGQKLSEVVKIAACQSWEAMTKAVRCRRETFKYFVDRISLAGAILC